MGISKYLKMGKMEFNSIENSLDIINTHNELIERLPKSDISSSDWGYIYEKYVG